MSKINNNQPTSIVSTSKSKQNLAIILGGILVVVFLISGTWFFVQSKDAKNAFFVQSKDAKNTTTTEQPNNTQQNDQYDNQDQSTEDSNLTKENFKERVEDNLKNYTNSSRGIQFAYNKAWQADKEEGAQNSDNLLFSNLPEGDSLRFSLLGVAGISGEAKDLRKGVNDDGFKYEIIRSFGFGGPEEKANQEVLYLWIRHSVNNQFEQQGVFSGVIYQYTYIFPSSKGESYLNQVVSELENIAKSFKYLYTDPYTVKLSSGKKLTFKYTINFKLTSDQNGIVTLSDKDYDSKVKLYYIKPVDINTTCLSESVKYPIKFDGLTAEYRLYENNKTNVPQCTNVSGVETIEVSLNGEKIFLEFNSSFSVDDRILLLVKSMEIQS